ncbi:hypothetical protein [Sphingobium yanoikuyae]|uniref:hypothetical protein n=1 Tax=Sphingobium yanoikuyae TaxID=13690 RepID=UPI001110960D|nr:hypothetical protein [Sphingobium yanoikuyae]
MPATVSTSVLYHGKRHRIAVTAKDDSPEAFAAALEEMQDKARNFREEITPQVKRQSYRKKKGR